MVTQYDFFRTKYGEELLIDLIGLEDLDQYIRQTPVQRLSYYDITVITGGEGIFTIDGHEETLNKGSVFFSSPGQIRMWNADTTPNGFALIFEEEFLCTFFNDKQFVKRLLCFGHASTHFSLLLNKRDLVRLTRLLEDIKSEIASFRNNDKHILRALLYQTLIFLERRFASAYPGTNQPANRHIESFVQLVAVRCFQNRSVEYYARQLCITGGHLNSLVKGHFATSAKKYILAKVMLEAKRLLLYTDMSVDQVAEYLHYENTNHFVKTFREHSGMTPLAFRSKKDR